MVVDISDKWLALREFLWAFIVNRDLNRKGKIFYNWDWKYQADILLESYWRLYRCKTWKTLEIKLSWIALELIWQDLITVDFPYLEDWVNINQKFSTDILTKWAVKNNYIDDITLTLFKELVTKNFFISYKEDGNLVWLVPKWWIKEVQFNLEELLNKEISLGYTNKDIWDKKRSWWYTHILRRNDKLKLQTWQIWVMYNWKQFNLIAWSRRIGKTFLSSSIAKRELYRKGSWYGARNRQILYICVSDDKMWQPLEYMDLILKEDIKRWFIKVSWKEYRNTITWTVLKFATAWSKTWAKSFGADLVIIDEAAEIPDSYWLDLLPIIMQEWATVFAISTINKGSQNGWFYKELVYWENSWDDKYNTIRATIDHNELLDDYSREATKLKIKEEDIIKYYTELYCIFPNSNTIFNLTWVVQPDETFIDWEYIIGYDPWKLNDFAWIIIIDIVHFRVIEEHKVLHLSYFDQKDFIKDLKKKYKAKVIMDRTWVWEAVAEIFNWVVDSYIKYKKTWWEVNVNEQYWFWNVPKRDLVETTQLYINNYWLKINASLIELIAQMKWFAWVKTWDNIKYTWVWVKDDLVNALMLAVYYMWKFEWITKRKQKEEAIQDEIFDQTFDWLFDSNEYSNGTIYSNYIY